MRAKPPKQALDYFKRKGLKPSFNYADVWREEHAISFTVAKMMQLDMLSELQQLLANNLRDGSTFHQFKKQATPYLQGKGWWGKKEQLDPLTGKLVEVQLGSLRRLKTIYQTNMRTARAAGQWQRVEQTKKTHPYLLYELGPSKEHREQHVDWAGYLLPVDDSFWKTNFPPNGHGCKCRVRQVSRREFEHLKNTGRYMTKEAPPLRQREWVNKRTGEIVNVPVGVDPGFDYNFGERQYGILNALTNKVNRSPELGAAAIESLLASEAFDYWHSNPQGNYPVAVLSEADTKLIGAKGRTVALLPRTIKKQKDHHPNIKASDYSKIPQAIARGEKIQVAKNDLAYVLNEPDGFITIVRVSEEEGTFAANLYRLSSKDKQRTKAIERMRKQGRKFFRELDSQ